jgi:hypothetical protein
MSSKDKRTLFPKMEETENKERQKAGGTERIDPVLRILEIDQNAKKCGCERGKYYEPNNEFRLAVQLNVIRIFFRDEIINEVFDFHFGYL